MEAVTYEYLHAISWSILCICFLVFWHYLMVRYLDGAMRVWLARYADDDDAAIVLRLLREFGARDRPALTRWLLYTIAALVLFLWISYRWYATV